MRPLVILARRTAHTKSVVFCMVDKTSVSLELFKPRPAFEIVGTSLDTVNIKNKYCRFAGREREKEKGTAPYKLGLP